MAVEKSAVRDGTHWDFRGRIVDVSEVTERTVVFRERFSNKPLEAEPLKSFLYWAREPVLDRHYCLSALLAPGDEFLGLNDAACELLDYLLERVGEPRSEAGSARVFGDPDKSPVAYHAELLKEIEAFGPHGESQQLRILVSLLRDAVVLLMTRFGPPRA